MCTSSGRKSHSVGRSDGSLLAIYKCYVSAVTTFDLYCTDWRLLTFTALKKSMHCVAIKCPFKVCAEALRVFFKYRK